METFDQAAFAAALDELLAIAAFDGDLPSVTADAGPIALTSRYRCAELSSAALAAGAVAAGKLSDDAPAVRLESRHVEASLLSFAHLNFHDSARGIAPRQAVDDRTVIGGFKRCGDGRWMYMHPGFPHNTEGLLDLLGRPDSPEAADRAFSGWSAPDLEAAVMDRGLCSAMVRSPTEWDASIPGRLLNQRPIVEIVQVGEADPLAHAPGDRPLSGCEVLDLTRVLAGPTCARTLASYGARARRIGAEHLPSVPLFVVDTGFGKQSSHIDLADAQGRARLDALLSSAHVFSQGYRTGAMERLGYGVAEVVRKRPGIVYVSINCYGHEGPWRAVPGWEQLAQTVTGIAATQGEDVDPDGAPMLLPAAVTDYTTGYLAAFGAMVALGRQRTLGGSYWVRVSLARTGRFLRSLGRRDSTAASRWESAEIERWSMTTETDWGPVDHLKPAVALDNTFVGWRQPPVPLGSTSL